MKIALKHQKHLKIYNGDMNYESILGYAYKEFSLPTESCCLTYFDDEGDEITICSTEDFSILLELYKEKPLIKINIKASDAKGLIEITDYSETAEKLPENTKKEEEMVKVEQTIENKSAVEQKEKNQNHTEMTQKERHHHGHRGHHGRGHGPHGHHGHHGHHRGHKNSDSSSSHEQRHLHKFHRMQKFMHEKIAHQVDERLKVLLPCLQNQLNPQNPIKLFSVASSLVHPNTECKGCFATPITGIRYKCLTCPGFSLCENCQTTVEHPHNLLKMKSVQESQDQKQTFPCFERWGNFSRGHSSSSSRSYSKCKDPEFWQTKKANKLAKIFGGQPEEYKEFIAANKDLHLGETIHKFAKQNNKEFSGFRDCKFNKASEKLTRFFGLSTQQAEKYIEQNRNLRPKELVQKYAKENSISQDELNQKRINFKCQKMAKIFERDPESFRQIVSTNLDLRPYQLKRLIMGQQFGQQCQRPWEFRHGCRNQKKQTSPFLKKQATKSPEEKKEKKETKSGQKKELHQEKKSRGNSAKKEKIEKSNILKTMVEYFGTYNIDQYYKLINEHFNEGQEKIIQLYIDSQAK